MSNRQTSAVSKHSGVPPHPARPTPHAHPARLFTQPATDTIWREAEGSNIGPKPTTKYVSHAAQPLADGTPDGARKILVKKQYWPAAENKATAVPPQREKTLPCRLERPVLPDERVEQAGLGAVAQGLLRQVPGHELGVVIAHVPSTNQNGHYCAWSSDVGEHATQ